VTTLGSLYQVRDGRTKRISSFDRTGGNADRITVKAGETAVMAEIEGAGINRHIWITIASKDPMIRRNCILRM
jgi:hypothetical protein